MNTYSQDIAFTHLYGPETITLLFQGLMGLQNLVCYKNQQWNGLILMLTRIHVF